VRRPGKTREQRQYDREQRALLRLRRAAVRWSESTDDISGSLADLQAAADAYTTSLKPSELRRLLK
jgi:hypothetical protein